MVEFGLKLEDNKVSEWSDYYLNYEKLKAILKKAKQYQKKYDDQASKRPQDAQRITEAHRAGNPNFVLTELTPSSSYASLTNLLGIASTDGPSPSDNKTNLEMEPQQEPSNTTPKETTPLLSPASATELVASTFSSKISDISEYFANAGESRYERTLRGYLKELDKCNQDFEDLLLAEQQKVVNFYNTKLQELNSRFQLLLDSVADSTYFATIALRSSTTLTSTEAGHGTTGIMTQDEEHATGPTGTASHPFLRDCKVMTPAMGHHTIGHSFNVGQSQPPEHHRRVSSTPKQRLEELFTKFSVTIKADLERFHASRNNNNNKSHPPHSPRHHHHEEEPDDKNNNNNNNNNNSHLYHKQFKKKVSHDDSDDEQEKMNEREEKMIAEADSIKRALIDQYRTAKLLHNFAILNYTGFVKIIKKHDKTIPTEKGKFKYILSPANLFQEGKAVDNLANRYERYYANWFCEGDIRAAHAQMLPKKGDGLEMDWSQLRLGYRMGMCAVLALWVCWDCIWGLVADGNSTIGGRVAFPVFRACGGILLLQWFWGCSVFIWTRYRVNYIYLFDFNPRIVATPLGIFEDAVDNTLVFMLIMLLYYKAGAHDIPKWIPDGCYPLLLVLYTITQLVFPLKSRMPMWEAIGKVVTAPLHSPSFFHGYVGDIFTSMVKVFQDVAWTIFWVLSGDFMRNEDMKESTSFHWSTSHLYKNVLIPIICLLPLVFRFNQCLRRYIDTGDRFPHLANATKYALSQTVTLFGAFHPLYLEYGNHQDKAGSFNLFQLFWMVVFVSSSLYSFTWDVYMDWGLGRPEFNFLGPSLMYPKRYYYYYTIAIDLVLRFMWVLTLIPPSSGARFEVPSYLSAVTMMLELFRRTLWGFFRLENEHRSNAAGFRRVSFVPLHFNTGHHHGYKDKKEKSGLAVLREVVLIALLVVGVCVSSVVAAQRANRVNASFVKEL